MSDFEGVDSVDSGSIEMDEVPDSQPEVENDTGGPSSDGVQEQMESESEATETPEAADDPDYDNEADSAKDESDEAELGDSEVTEPDNASNPDCDIDTSEPAEANNVDEYENVDPDNPDIGEDLGEQQPDEVDGAEAEADGQGTSETELTEPEEGLAEPNESESESSEDINPDTGKENDDLQTDDEIEETNESYAKEDTESDELESDYTEDENDADSSDGSLDNNESNDDTDTDTAEAKEPDESNQEGINQSEIEDREQDETSDERFEADDSNQEEADQSEYDVEDNDEHADESDETEGSEGQQSEGVEDGSEEKDDIDKGVEDTGISENDTESSAEEPEQTKTEELQDEARSDVDATKEISDDADAEPAEEIEGEGGEEEAGEAEEGSSEEPEAATEKIEDLEAEEPQGEARSDVGATKEISDDADAEPAEEIEGEVTKEETEGKEAREGEVEALEIANKVREITAHYYEEAGDLARNNEKGRAFTDHKEAHVEMVAEKSLEAGDAIKEAIEKGHLGNNSDAEGHIAFNSNIDKNTLQGAALSHDTGMSGDGYALEKNAEGNYIARPENNDNFDEVRKNHSLNSAINVLKDRNLYKEAGYSDEQIDKMAVECMAHSKSSSGVSDLNSKANWSDCFDRIDATIEAYNKDHPDSHISFERSTFENDDNKLGSLASETYALRIGDVSRNSGPDAEAHSGEVVHIDRTTIDNKAVTPEGEVKKAEIILGDEKFESTPEMSSKQKSDIEFSRTVHVGEQNIIDNHTFVSNDGSLTHEVTVNDGDSAPHCTQRALEDHLGELASAKDENSKIHIAFDKPYSDETRKSYNEWRVEIVSHEQEKYNNVSIEFPWDKE